jgi:rubrerythrin
MYGMHNGMDQSTIEQGLQKSMDEEVMAIAVYRARAAAARSEGDDLTASLWDHIAEEEDTHYHEFSDRLDAVTMEARMKMMGGMGNPMQQSSHGMEQYYPGGHPHAMAHRKFPESYSDWLELAEDIKVTDRSFDTQTKVNTALRTIGDRDSDPPDVSAAERYLMTKAHELHID